MAILAYGLNYRTAPIDLRERIAFPADAIVASLTGVRRDLPQVAEVAILSTCNRTEMYCAMDRDDHVPLLEWLSDTRHISTDTLVNATYAHWDQQAARHLMRVAAGLDSQVLGEPQILGQVKSAYDVARNAGTLGPELNLLSQVTLNVAKRVRSDTDIGRNPVSVAYAAVTLAAQIFTDLKDTRALLIGAGETIELLARHLRESGVKNIGIANRTLENAQYLAARFGARAMQLTDVAGALADADVVISSTGSSMPVLGKGAVEAALKRRKHRPIFMVDLAVPRDIEPEVAELRDVYLYSIDDLTEVIEDNLSGRRSAAEVAEGLVLEGADHYFRERRVRDGQALLEAFRARAELMRASEVERALKRIRAGADAEEVLNALAHGLTNKLIHPPTVAIRKASAEGRSELLDLTRSLYGLDGDDHA